MLGMNEFDLNHYEAALAAEQALDRLLNRSAPPNIDAPYIKPFDLEAHKTIALLLGDYTNAISYDRSGAEISNNLGTIDPAEFRTALALSLARQHDAIAALAYWRDMPPGNPGGRGIVRLQIDAALENWQAVVTSAASVERTFAQFNPRGDFNAHISTGVRPFLALAKAKLGDTAGAEAEIATTASDCYDCIRMRGNIAAMERNWGRADYWFARAVQQAPSIPFAYTDWGQSLLARGDLDGASAKFTIANQKGPKFADPLEMWAETLILQKHPDQALAKFEESDKYAPNWGRLHLKWGEALLYAGRRDEAAKQFAISSGLDLVTADTAELARVSSAHG